MSTGPKTMMPQPIETVCIKKCSQDKYTIWGNREVKRSRCKRCGGKLIKL